MENKEKENEEKEKKKQGRTSKVKLVIKLIALLLVTIIMTNALAIFIPEIRWLIEASMWAISWLVESPIWTWLIVGLFIWFIFWIRMVKVSEHGNKSFFGNMGEKYIDEKTGKVRGILPRLVFGYCKSGLHLMPRFPGCGIPKIPKKRFKLDFEPRITISKRTKAEDGEKFGKQLLEIDGMVYTEFGRDFESVKRVIERGVPTTEDGLVAYTDGLIDSAYREAIGSMDWGKATEKEGRDIITDTVEERIIDDNSIFSLAGLNTENTTVGIKVVDLQSEDLKKSIVRPDVERFQEEGAVYEAGRIRKEAEVIGEIRETLKDKGFDKKNIDKIAHDVYELQVSKDLQKETKIPVVKIIRWEGPGGVAPHMAQMMAGMAIGNELMPMGGKTTGEKTEKKKTEEEERIAAGMDILGL